MEVLLYTIFKYIHILSAIIGAGGAFASDYIFLKSHKDKVISKDEFSIIAGMSHVVWVGLAVLVVSGAVLFGMNYEVLLASSGFLAKQTILLVVLVNGVFFHYLHIPYMKKHLNHHLFPKNKENGSDFFVFSGVLSITSWLCIISISSLKKLLPLSYFGYMGIYTLIIAVASIVAFFVMRTQVHEKEKQTLKHAAVVTLVLSMLCGLLVVLAGVEEKEKTKVLPPEQPTQEVEVYTLSDVGRHNVDTDCWVIVDEQVFDVTVAQSHSGAFHCGQDVSVNYHKNHGPVVRPQMMVFKVGDLKEGEVIGEQKEVKNKSLSPKFVQYVSTLDIDSRNLMFIVEKNNASLLVVDASTHTQVGRFEGVGFQPHGVVFSHNLQYAYSISRDGWVIQIDMKKLEPIAWVRVGESSRGIALSDDGKFVVLGNYEPGDVVLVNTKDMTISNRIKLERFVDGKDVSSRAGVVVEDGNRFVVALKDLNGVWILDPSSEDDVVVKKFWNVGGVPSLLHDGFLTPDGKYFIVAAQDANNVWIMDLQTGKAVTNVTTGIKPHTGPGAYAYNTVYVPALGEGKLTAIEYGTWKVKKYIETAGPGLFARSYNKDPEYPYVWADTAFFEGADKVYVIDARNQEIVKTLVPVEGKMTIHPEFSFDGKFVYVASSEGNVIVVYDSHTFEEVTRFDAKEPSGIFNVGTRIEEPGL